MQWATAWVSHRKAHLATISPTGHLYFIMPIVLLDKPGQTRNDSRHGLLCLHTQDLSQYGDVHGYLLVFSITSKQSYYYVKEILETLATNKAQRHLACILVANKGDLVRNREVSENGKRSIIYIQVMHHYFFTKTQDALQGSGQTIDSITTLMT